MFEAGERTMWERRSIAARISIVYALFAAGWIVASSVLVLSLPEPIAGSAEITKGLLFVAVTSAGLYFVVRRWTAAIAAESGAAAEARRAMQQVIDTVPFGVILLDKRGVVDFVNPTAEGLLGASFEECIGTPLDALCGPQMRQDFAFSVGELLATGCIDGLEIQGPGGGSPRAVIARAAEIDPESPGEGWVIALADYTEAQEQRQRSARLLQGYRFVSEMAALMGRARDEEQLFGQLCELAVEEGGFEAAWAVVQDGATGEFREVGSVGLGQVGPRLAAHMARAQSDSGSGMFAQIAEGKVHVNNSLATDPDEMWASMANELGVGSDAVFAIVENRVTHAVVGLFAEEPGYFGAEELRLINTLRSDLCFSVERLALDARRLAAEEALERSEEGYRELFDYNPQPMWVYDLDTLDFLAVNEAAVVKYGYSRDRFAQMTIKDVRPDREVSQLLVHIARKGPGLQDAGYWTHRDANGREFPVHVLTHAMAWAGHNAELVMVQEVATVG